MNNYTKPEISVQTDNRKPVTNPYAIMLQSEDISKYLGHPNALATMIYCGLCTDECMETVSCKNCVNTRG